MLLPFEDEQRRLLVNLGTGYDAWLTAARTLRALPYNLTWKQISGRDYLYRLTDRQGSGTSIGPRSPETEAAYNSYREEKAQLQDRIGSVQRQIELIARQYRALRLPMIPAEAGDILREADLRGLLDGDLLVVGTNAMPAYCIEANGFIDVPMETRDFDMTWANTEMSTKLSMTGVRPVWDMLKAVDPTYTWVEEKPFQARNRKAFEFELLAAPSTIGTLGNADRPRPLPLPEQEWLLLGQPLSHVVIDRDLKPARLRVPDPRYFALQKLWLSQQEKRNPLKRPKDARQGLALLHAVSETMPQYPIDEEFRSGLPEELREPFSHACERLGINPSQPRRPTW